MNTRMFWSRIFVIVGSSALLAGTLRPGSWFGVPFILPGSGMIALGALLGKDERGVIPGWVPRMSVLLAASVGLLFALNAANVLEMLNLGWLLILPGGGMVALVTFFGRGQRGIVRYWKWVFIVIAAGVAALLASLAVGGIGGRTLHSDWWVVLLWPYVVGWIMGFAGLVVMLARFAYSLVKEHRAIPSGKSVGRIMLGCAAVAIIVGTGRMTNNYRSKDAAVQKYRLTPLPASLEKVRGIHPRLYLDSARVTELRQAVQTTHAPLWKELRECADRAVKRGRDAYHEHDNSSGDEQLWQREVGNAMPVLAMAWVLSREQPYLEAARQWALASCGYRTWGLGGTDGMDLAAGHQLFGLGLVYDWCYADLGEEARRTIRGTLVKRTSALFEAAATGKVWWHQSYLQSHLWVNISGMAVAGMAMFDEVDDAAGWIGLPLEKFQRTMAALGPDGASHEGVGYWEYGAEHMLKFMDLARTRLDANLYTGQWWRHTALYAQYLALPRHAWTSNNCIVDIADCARRHLYGPDYLLRVLAREFHDGHAQWLAREIDDAGVATPISPWLNLLWFEPALLAEPPSSLPTLRHFDDLGLVSARSDWSGDESLVVFKCGPCLGHQAVQAFSCDPGGGHVHPDANHFVLFGAGEWLVRDDGYSAKWTGQHNTLLVDDRGQLGEGSKWFGADEAMAVKARTKIVRAASTPDLDQMTGEASEAYPRDLGLRRYLRHLLFLKPDVLLVCDEVVTDKPRRLELRFHPENRHTVREGNAFVWRGAKTSLRLEILEPSPEVSLSAEDLTIEAVDGKKYPLFTVRVSKQTAVWRNAVALSWSASGQPTKTVQANTQGDVWRFSVDGRSVTLDWASGLARMVAARRPTASP